MNYFVTGTSTDVGKTIITTLLTDFLSLNDRLVFPYKPNQTRAKSINGSLIAPDTEVYKRLKDLPHSDKFYTYLFKTPSSPHLAAKKENVVINLANIQKTIKSIQKENDSIVVEGAGGLYVPITDEGYCMLDLIKELSFPVILVADAGLGTINHSVLTIKTLKAFDIRIIGVIINRTNQENRVLELDNMKMIERLTNVPIVGTVPYEENIENKLQEKRFRMKLTKDWNRKRIEY